MQGEGWRQAGGAPIPAGTGRGTTERPLPARCWPGRSLERAAELARDAFRYDILKAEALAPGASIQRAGKAIEQWT